MGNEARRWGKSGCIVEKKRTQNNERGMRDESVVGMEL